MSLHFTDEEPTQPMPNIPMDVLVGMKPEAEVVYRKTYEPKSDGVPQPIIHDERTEPVVAP